MKATIRDLIWVIIVFALGLAAWKAKQESASIRWRLLAMEAETGYIKPASPDNAYVRQLPNSIVDEWNFRIVVPQGKLCEFTWSHNLDGKVVSCSSPSSLFEGQHGVRVSIHGIFSRTDVRRGDMDWVMFRVDSEDQLLNCIHAPPEVARQVRTGSDFYSNESRYEDFAEMSEVVDECKPGDQLQLLRLEGEGENKTHWMELNMAVVDIPLSSSVLNSGLRGDSRIIFRYEE